MIRKANHLHNQSTKGSNNKQLWRLEEYSIEKKQAVLRYDMNHKTKFSLKDTEYTPDIYKTKDGNIHGLNKLNREK